MEKRKIINLTGKIVRLNSGEEFLPEKDENGIDVIVKCKINYLPTSKKNVFQTEYKVLNMPQKQENTIYIVSFIVMIALTGIRNDVVCAAEMSPDCTIIGGKIHSVPFLTVPQL